MFKKRYPGLGFKENFLGGHITIGRLTIYGENAMHWAVNFKMKNGFFCFKLPIRCFGTWWPLYCYFSPNATPAKATHCFWGRKTHGGFSFLDEKEKENKNE